MTTTLPLFWKLSSNVKQDRLSASVKLVSALEQLQLNFVPSQDPPVGDSSSEEDESENHQDRAISNKGNLDGVNAPDVIYSIRRLVRGLASPRESSRLGFAVALTELLSRLETISASQVLSLISQASEIHGSMKGQEERDMLFARLFGVTSLIQSGLLFRTIPLATSSTPSSTLKDFQDAMEILLTLVGKKSFLKESSYWAIILALRALKTSEVVWKDEAWTWIIQRVFIEEKVWSPEKIGVVLTLQTFGLEKDWKALLSPQFKSGDILSKHNLSTLAKVLKDTDVEEPDTTTNTPKAKNSSPWKPQLHFVWGLILDTYFPPENLPLDVKHKAPFPEFFRVVVDESLLAPASSDGRKLWGFEFFRLSAERVPPSDLPRLFTPNFMRSWVNHLSKPDRYLHKAAKLVASSLPPIVTANPSAGLPILLQLLQTHGHFDRLTKTKTVESMLSAMDVKGVEEYVSHLCELATKPSSKGSTAVEEDPTSIRVWVADQISMLIRNGNIPKASSWVIKVLDFLLVHGLFSIRKKGDTSKNEWLRSLPEPTFSDKARSTCRTRLLSCLCELNSQTTVIKLADDKSTRRTGCAPDGELWLRKVFSTLVRLEKDTKHMRLENKDRGTKIDEETRDRILQTIEKLDKVDSGKKHARDGVELLLMGTFLYRYLNDDDEDENENENENENDDIEICINNAEKLFASLNAKDGKRKKKRKSEGPKGDDMVEDDVEPITAIVDVIIGYLEKSSSYLRSVANQSFGLMTSEVDKATVDLILAQLERRNPSKDEDEDEDEELMGEEEEEEELGDEEVEEVEEESSGSDEQESDQSDDENEEEDPELRRKVKEVFRGADAQESSEEGDEKSESESSQEEMDDDQMMELDAQLAEVFRSQAKGKRKKDVGAQREATHFKNRVLDLVDIFLGKEPASPFTIAFPVPLIQVIMGTGADEKQLSDKVKALLRSRFIKSKEIPLTVDLEATRNSLQELHTLARKIQSSDLRDIISGCSIYISRILLSDTLHDEKTVLDAYRTSLSDFAMRKASPLQSSFIQDFIQRQARFAWQLRDDILQAAPAAVNDYRKCQTFLLFQTLFTQLGSIDLSSNVTSSFFPKFREEILQIIRKACDDPTLLNAAQVKELLKTLLLAVRQTKRFIVDKDSFEKIWTPAAITSLHENLKASRFKTSASLLSLCQQVLTSSSWQDKNKDSMKSGQISHVQKKRKTDDTNDEGRQSKRRKGKKHNDTVISS